MKDDAPTPATIPKKRRQLEDALDRWLAEWLERDDLTPSERRRLEEERADRKRRRAIEDVRVGVLVGPEGVTPAQAAGVLELVKAAKPTAIVHAGLRSRSLMGGLEGFPVLNMPDFQAVVRLAGVVVAAPREPDVPTHKAGVWAGVKYAKHRRVAVRVVLPNGEEAA